MNQYVEVFVRLFVNFYNLCILLSSQEEVRVDSVHSLQASFDKTAKTHFNTMHRIRHQFGAFKCCCFPVQKHQSKPYKTFCSSFKALNPKCLSFHSAHDFLLHGLIQTLKIALFIPWFLHRQSLTSSSGRNNNSSFIEVLFILFRNSSITVLLNIATCPVKSSPPFVSIDFPTDFPKGFVLLPDEQHLGVHSSFILVSQNHSSQNCWSV